MKVVRRTLGSFVCLSLVLSLTQSAFGQPSFPTSPDPSLTPGSLCDKPDSKRYPEGIPYCSRSVKSDLKRDIMETYDEKLSYKVTSMKRADFKIDHYIPLCMGGSNQPNNLWPQHESVYEITDPLEQIACEKMAAGKLRQAEAVELLRRAKANLGEAPAIIRQVARL